MPNQFPVIRVYPPCSGHNGVVYALATDRPGGFEINKFFHDPEVLAKTEIKKYWSALKGLNTRKDPDGRLGFFLKLKHEFCEFGHAFPPDPETIEKEADDLADLAGTKLRTYLMRWEQRTLILLIGLIKDIPPDAASFDWQSHPHLQRRISPLIDLYYAIKDGLKEHDFFYIPGQPGFYDENNNLKEEIELKRFVAHGGRLSCDRDQTRRRGLLSNSATGG